MKNKFVFTLVLLCIYILSFIPPVEVSGQSGFYINPVYPAFFDWCPGGGCDRSEYLEAACPAGALAGVIVFQTGTIDWGNGVTSTYSNPLKIIAISGSGATTANMASEFNSYIGGSLGTNSSTVAGLTQMVLGANTEVAEFYGYCSGSGSTPSRQEYIDRFSYLEVVDLQGYSHGSSSSWTVESDHSVLACGEEKRLAGNWVHVASNSADGGTRVNNDYRWSWANAWFGGSISIHNQLSNATWRDQLVTFLGSSIGTVQIENTSTGLNRWGGDLAASYPLIWSNVYAYCFDITMPSTGTGINYLSDGDMEQQPVSSSWAMAYQGGRTGNGRIDTTSGGNAEYYGDAHCEDGIQAIGNFSSTIPGVKTGDFADIVQTFTKTEIGKIYAQAFIKSLGAAATAKMTITSLSTGTVYTLYNDVLGPVWNSVGGSTPSLAAGNYQIKISLDSASPDPRILVDDVRVSDGPFTSFTCPSALPTPTPTPNVTGTPLGNYQAIFNCGFSYGDEAWNMTTKYQSHDPYIVDTSYVVYGGDNNYAFVENYYNASISQPFWWPSSAMAYLKFDVGSGGLQFPNYTVTIKNSSTNQVVYSKTDPSVLNFEEFAEIRDTVYLPNGLYDIKLTFGSQNSPATFDNITLGRNGYYICPVDPVATATAQPTHDPSTPTPIRTFTAVPTRTQQPTSTVATGQPTSTPIPSFTPPSTQTPWPTPTKTPTPGAATRTPGPAPTYTQYPTYTSQPPLPTHTPQPSYTPNSQGTIEPSITPTGTLEIPSPQPPPNYYAPCDRPQTYDPIAFAQYEQCTLLSFFMWSPRAGATLSAMGTLVVGKEPFGTIEEFSQTNKDLMGYVNSYDWGDTGMPGTGDSPDPNIFLQPGADNPWFSGHIDFTAPEDMPVPDDTCSNRLTTVLGPNISKGYCWMVNFLASKGITPWMQLLIDIGALAFLGAYIVKKWIDAGSVA